MSTHASESPSTMPPDVKSRIETTLREAAESRQSQLDGLPPPTDGDPTPNSAHRQTVERLLTEIQAAQERLANGTFGGCEKCGTAIPIERLELRPWASVCVRCADR